jgi:hypothetical protein
VKKERKLKLTILPIRVLNPTELENAQGALYNNSNYTNRTIDPTTLRL